MGKSVREEAAEATEVGLGGQAETDKEKGTT